MNAGAPCPCGIPVHHDLEAGYCVFLCERCGQPLTGPRDLCQSALHVGNDGYGVGHAVRSTELARLAGAAVAALGGPR